MVERKEAAFLELAKVEGGAVSMSVFPGVISSLQALQRSGVPVALCTSSLRDSCDAVLTATRLDEFFPAPRRTTLDDVPAGQSKPRPEVRAT